MEITTEIVQQALASSEMPNGKLASRRNSTELTASQQRYLECYGTAESLMKDFIPDNQALFARDATKSLEGDCPTIADMRRVWSEKYAEAWLSNQLRDLSEYAGPKEKLTFYQLEDATRMIISEFYYFKLSEFMLFFAYFKGGRYGRFYGGVDPLVITEALHKFKKWRNSTLDYIAEEKRRKEIEQKPARDPECITREEWLRYKPYYEKGISIEDFRQKYDKIKS